MTDSTDSPVAGEPVEPTGEDTGYLGAPKWSWERIPDGNNGKRALIGGSARQLEVWLDRGADGALLVCLHDDARFADGEYSIQLEDIDWLRGKL